MQKIISPLKENWSEILKRPTQTFERVEKTVNYIFKDVQLHGEKAVKKYAKKYDKVILNELLVSQKEIYDAIDKVPNNLKTAIQLAKSNIEKFHQAQVTKPVKVQTIQGVNCWQEKRAIQKVGLYIPGGTAPLFSTILMLAIPAKIAGCEEVILCTPTNKSGTINEAILYTANLCGVTKIFKVGGIQAIAAMTFGIESIPKVYKILGPGNQFVTIAKQMATKYGIAIDLPAGPSELLVFADDTANASFVASDLLSQAEHGEDSQVILVSTSKSMIEKVALEVENQIELLPRKAIASKAIANSKLIYCENDDLAIQLIDEYAPEHFIICTENEEFYVDNIRNAGSVFIGNYTPESAGDYASGTNHTLPTNGFAKNYSGVNLDTFLKAITFQKITKKGLQNIGASIEILAEAEGLEAHKNAVTLRLKSINKN
ncbi:MAG: histidinol dehydrogenase [Flavobacteriaceae bacterium]|nr:histidinol dehydrogenase [Flavobacteriaceae bacterium]